MDNNDQPTKMTELVIEALSYAHSNNLDITSESDVEKILYAIDPDRSSVDNVEEFMKLLHAANTLIEEDVKRRRNTN